MQQLHDLARYLSQTRYEDLPTAVIARATDVIRDSLGVMIAGMREPEVRALAEHAAFHHPGTAGLVGHGGRVTPEWAVLVNATAGNTLELDEGHAYAFGHAAIHALPTSLALGQHHRATPRGMLLAFVLAYETAARAGVATRLRAHVHPFGAWGVLGAAAAAAHFKRMSADDIAGTLELAASYAINPSFNTALQGANVRNTYSGVVNRNGLLAAELHGLGFRGERGALATTFGQILGESFNPAALTDGLGTRFELLRGYFKPYSSCRYTHPTVAALLALRPRLPEPDRIRAVRVATYQIAARLNDPAPETPLGGRFSIPHVAAAVLVLGHADPEAFSTEMLHDPRLRGLGARVHVSEDPALTALLPAQRAARVTVELEDGSHMETLITRTKGDPDLPMSEAELREKFVRLVAPSVGPGRADGLWSALGRLPELAELPALH